MVDVRNHIGSFDQSGAAAKENALAQEDNGERVRTNDSSRSEWKAEARIRGGRWLVTVSEGVTRERIQDYLLGSKRIETTVGKDEEHERAESVISKFQTKNVGHRQKAASFQTVSSRFD